MSPRWSILPWLAPGLGALACVAAGPVRSAQVSEATTACIGCHEAVTPGIVADWKHSRHAAVTPAEALSRPGVQRRYSAASPPAGMGATVVGCAECHRMKPERHPDSFEHNGHKVHIVVSPEDCAGCHPEERGQYANNLMANAHGNLQENTLYRSLADSVNGAWSVTGGGLALAAPDPLTDADSCLSCHGTRVEAQGLKERATAMGAMAFPVLTGWPNQGVGRVNPDGSKGACTSCHARHRFAIELARQPATCSQCHKGPDVPASEVYSVSKHGNIYDSLRSFWEFSAVPWIPGEHFTAPTCAGCHVSLLATEDGAVLAERTHRMNDRLAWRLFGPLYAQPHPAASDTTVLRNAAGLPLPVELTGEPASSGLIDAEEQAARDGRMKRICSSCHSGQWIAGHFARLAKSIETTNAATLAATRLMLGAWSEGLARGLAADDSIFNEVIERTWVSNWLFHANSSRFASAMGGADFGVFANGRYHQSANLLQLNNAVKLLRAALPK